MGKPRVPLDPVADLRHRLARLRGAPIAKIRACVRTWWADHDFDKCPASIGKRIATAMIEHRTIEDKLAGIAILEDAVSDQLRVTDLPGFAQLFDDGHISDAVVVDWFTSKVLVALLARAAGRIEVARQIATWRYADTIWQRRAACLAFLELAPAGDDAITDIALRICATVLWSHERFDQTAVGWLLRELSRGDPARVDTFFRRHARFMSKECARHAVSKLPVTQRTALLAHHKRATSIRR
ncbi:MAG: DNA alkylation repair protein [Myxococcota bacterium]|nr:DNA alkylation repair protein [Deltaproteobacteria bacterium]MDQ3337897.1 DNA alkylation repair protein [Myxococcota bacterium]